MTRSIKIYIGVLILLFAATVIIEFSTPRPVNWERTYNETHTIPYGTYILYNELGDLFPESQIVDIDVTPYEFFTNLFDWEAYEYTNEGTYMYIAEYMDADDVSVTDILDFVSYGNDVFISSSYFPEKLMDSLHFKTAHEYNFTGKADLSFANPTFGNDSITIKKGLSNIHFSELDSTITTVLGYQRFNFEDKVNYVKIAYKTGNVYVHLQPVVFTNYMLLKNDNKKYAAAALSYVSDKTIFYDARNKSRRNLSDSPFRFILSKPALKWGWYLALISLIIFVIFNAKRKQRVVRVIKPLENTTVAFTKTIGNLYYETKDHNNIIDKKITYFLEYLRRIYYLDTQIMDDKFVKALASKSGRDFGRTKKLINMIVHLKAKQHCDEHDLLSLNAAIEDFHKQ